MSKLFNRGYKAVDKEKERQEKEKKDREGKLWEFFLSGDGDEASIRFINNEPVTFYMHQIQRKSNGKEFYDSYVCSGSDCPYCEQGSKTQFKGAYLIIDRREYEYTDDNGKKKKGTNQLRLYIPGTKVLSQLKRLNSKYGGLTSRDFSIERLGKGTSTTYMLTPEDKEPLDVDIEDVLPEVLADLYDGTEDSIYDIIEDQLRRMMPNNEEEEEEYDNSDKIVDDEEEEEEPPKPKKSLRQKDNDEPPKKKSGLKSRLLKKK